MELKNKKINFLGDSITEGVGSSDREKTSYIRVFEALSGAVCRNYGIGGTQIAYQTQIPQGKEHYADTFCRRVEKMDADADIVVIFGGTNDYGHGDAPLGSFSDRTDATFYGALHTLYSSVIEKYPAATVVVLTPLHREGEENPMPYLRDFPTASLKGYVEAIREVAEHYALPVLDLYSTSGICPDLPVSKALYTTDGLHPNDLGHARIANRLYNFLKNL